ncbi:hypothetical protein VC83_04444 [Pseudogymnoascus destructans]|uniref:DASH complex subunit DAD1 n=1 Tax=Pseudogymnoascus destructans TaxID=655981 RepID=A0A177ACP1_9PEZI|nr:uncharacterized protein VC83_04444 [Pseudogymnoascus destructans]OAF59041.1 hypothetical protein VC83_04444 [Pseudogymnoascus destructans]
MSTSTKPPTGAGASTNAPGERTYFEAQRAALLGEIGVSLEHVLANINKLNRSLEGVIAVGNEFGSVEALWSQFENVMGHEPVVNEGKSEEGGSEGDYEEGEGEGSEVDESRV